MKKLTLLLMCFIMSMGLAVAQNLQITGVVVDETGEFIVGASVRVVGASGIGASTDVNGKFSLSVPRSAKTLHVTFLGMEDVNVSISENMRIVMKESAQALEEVIVTGYGNVKRGDFTGAASKVGMAKLADVPTVSVGAKLAGSTSGVQVVSTSGQPGSVESIRIRGMGSINASNNPLFVIDGVPMMTGNASAFGYSVAGNSLLSTINSGDIESMTVIKDAAAASLYGSRAANGVIVITTKKGAAGKTRFNFNADGGYSEMAVDYRPTLDGPDRYDFLYTSRYNQYKDAGYADEVAAKNATDWAKNYGSEPGTGWANWRDALFRKGGFQNYRLSVQGGNDKTKIYSSLSYSKQDGVTVQSGYERYTGNLNLSQKEGKFEYGGSTMFSIAHQKVNSEGTSYSSPIMAISMTCSPSDAPYNPDGSINISSGFKAFPSPLANPLYSATLNYDKSDITRTLNNVYARYEIISGLSLKESLSYDFIQTNNRVWWDPRSNDGRSSSGVYQRYMINRSRYVLQSQLSYAKTFNNLHNVDAIVSYELENNTEDYTYANGNTYSTYKLNEIINAGNNRASSEVDQTNLISYVSRLNYNYNNKYYIGGSFRRDGTSRLAPDKRWGNFWSASASWRFTEENFLSSFKSILTDGKLRASYGVNGTQPLGYYDYLGTYGYGYKYNGVSGMVNDRLNNDDLTWEKNYATNIGIELGILNRISLLVDYYNRDTKDLLFNKSLSRTTGFSAQMSNVASMNNRGFEIELKTTNIETNDMRWVTGFTFSHNKNKVEELSTPDQKEIIDGVMIYRVGNPFFSYYLYEYAGVDPKTGKESYYVNKEGKEREITTDYNQASRILAGSTYPKLAGGITSDFTWKFIDFNFTLTYSLGGKILDRATWLQSNGGINPAFNIPSYYQIDKAWKKEGDVVEIPRLVYGTLAQPSTRWMLSNDHLRLKNITLGVRVPTNIVKKAGLERVRVYASGSNLLTFKSKDLYVDPECPVDGLVTYQSPALRTITFGLEIGF